MCDLARLNPIRAVDIVNYEKPRTNIGNLCAYKSRLRLTWNMNCDDTLSFLSGFITVTLSPALILNKTLPSQIEGSNTFFALPDCLSPFNLHIKQGVVSLKCPYPWRFSRVRVKGRKSGEYTIPGREAGKCFVSHLNQGRKKTLKCLGGFVSFPNRKHQKKLSEIFKMTSQDIEYTGCHKLVCKYVNLASYRLWDTQRKLWQKLKLESL